MYTACYFRNNIPHCEVTNNLLSQSHDLCDLILLSKGVLLSHEEKQFNEMLPDYCHSVLG